MHALGSRSSRLTACRLVAATLLVCYSSTFFLYPSCGDGQSFKITLACGCLVMHWGSELSESGATVKYQTRLCKGIQCRSYRYPSDIEFYFLPQYVKYVQMNTLLIPLFPFPVATLVWLAWSISRPKRRVRRGLCAYCGYDLRDNVSGRCPECNTLVPNAVFQSNR